MVLQDKNIILYYITLNYRAKLLFRRHILIMQFFNSERIAQFRELREYTNTSAEILWSDIREECSALIEIQKVLNGRSQNYVRCQKKDF